MYPVTFPRIFGYIFSIYLIDEFAILTRANDKGRMVHGSPTIQQDVRGCRFMARNANKREKFHRVKARVEKYTRDRSFVWFGTMATARLFPKITIYGPAERELLRVSGSISYNRAGRDNTFASFHHTHTHTQFLTCLEIEGSNFLQVVEIEKTREENDEDILATVDRYCDKLIELIFYLY